MAAFILSFYVITSLVGLIKLLTVDLFFRGVILTPKRSLKNSFSGVKITLDIGGVKISPKEELSDLYLKFLLHFWSYSNSLNITVQKNYEL